MCARAPRGSPVRATARAKIWAGEPRGAGAHTSTFVHEPWGAGPAIRFCSNVVLTPSLLQISRVMDPMADRSMYMSCPDVWDHTSNMHEYIKDPELMAGSSEFPRKVNPKRVTLHDIRTLTPAFTYLQLWQWIFDHRIELLQVDTLIAQKTTLEEVRFYNFNLNRWALAGQNVINNEMSTFGTATEQWIGVLGSEGWTRTDTDAVSEITATLVSHVARPPQIDKLASRRVNRPARIPTSALPKAAVTKYECLRFLSLNALEWRYFDSNNRRKMLAGIALFIYVAHKLYVQQSQLVLHTDVGLKLRNDFVKFLSDNWKVPQSSVEPSVVLEKKRSQWDDPIVTRILTDAPPPTRTREEALVAYDKAIAETRWEKYALDVKRIVTVCKASSFARNIPGDTETVNEDVAAAIDGLIDVRFYSFWLTYVCMYVCTHAHSYSSSPGCDQERQPVGVPSPARIGGVRPAHRHPPSHFASGRTCRPGPELLRVRRGLPTRPTGVARRLHHEAPGVPHDAPQEEGDRPEPRRPRHLVASAAGHRAR